MTDSLLQRYVKPAAKTDDQSPLTLAEPETEATDDCGAFGFLRGVRDRALMLELRKKDGNIKAVGYAWLSQAEFDPSVGITLHFAGQQIRIRGRNLNAEIRPNVRLYQGIVRHRVQWIQELDEPALMNAGEQDTVIEKIEW
jgi:hypothetical protein